MSGLRAEPELRRLLETIDAARGDAEWNRADPLAEAGTATDAEAGAPAAIVAGIAAGTIAADVGGCVGVDRGQDRADALLARVVWSRLVEPGDGLAGALISVLGPSRLLELLVRRASVAEVVTGAGAGGVQLEPRAVSAAFERWRPRLDRSASVGDVERAAAARLRLVLPGDPLWPEALTDLGPHAPLLLWVRGDPAFLSARSLAVVGARAATGYGTHLTAEIIEGVSVTGTTIVSGAAYGIDAVAHRTALALGVPTVAVLAGGAERAYPAAHDRLLERIADEGAVCSEMVPGAAPTRWRFLQRNRIIAALAAATLVTEAGVRSGTLNTAGHAAELARPLGAVPGPVTSAASAGCHRLLREYGATLVTNAAEACELLGIDLGQSPGGPARGARARGRGSGDPGGVARGDRDAVSDGRAEAGTAVTAQPAQPAQPEQSAQSALHCRALDALPLRGSRSLSDIARLAGLTSGEARAAIAELEILGFVQRRETPNFAEPTWALNRRQ